MIDDTVEILKIMPKCCLMYKWGTILHTQIQQEECSN
jgi:hypothetical protein